MIRRPAPYLEQKEREAECLSLSLSYPLSFFIQKLRSTKIRPAKLKFDFGNVIYEVRSTFLPISLRYFHKLLSFEILDEILKCGV
jgi:hypothetical protein